ncbi:MAG: hypothetical protein J0G94_01660 [Sphingomonadales bacterium]|nr:hypothetical protein [Sphingomonadales bacterium]
MSIQTAAAILQRLGPCRIALDLEKFGDFARELALAGCDPVDLTEAHNPRGGKLAVFLDVAGPFNGAAFGKALLPAAKADFLVLQSSGQPRHSLESALFDAGWERHPGGMMAHDYASWSAYALPGLTHYRRASGGEPGALRQSGVEADALVARYAMAANHVRPGDHVLIDGAGATDGKAILTALSRAARIDTAGADLADIPDNSVDLIIAIEPQASGDWIARLDDHARILRCDGRIVLGWRHGQSGHARPQDWDALVEAVSARFLPETRWLQHGLTNDAGGPQTLYAVPLEQEADCDWMLLVASANPLAGEGRADEFDHPAFPAAEGPWPALVSFGGAYDNPWLYRAMVQMGERLSHDVTLARLAECVIEDARPDSADRGAALAVLGYRILEMRLPDLVQSILPVIAAYVDLPADDAMPPHVRRWRISLAFLAGRLSELTGEREAAKRWYRIAAQADWRDFSPLLATKGIAASFYEARLHLADGDKESALACFRAGLDTALAAAAFPHAEQIGPADRPLSFYLQELAEVIDMGSQCANALAHFPMYDRDQGLFWRQVDMRRFGLASWARDLERENQRLRAG